MTLKNQIIWLTKVTLLNTLTKFKAFGIAKYIYNLKRKLGIIPCKIFVTNV